MPSTNQDARLTYANSPIPFVMVENQATTLSSQLQQGPSIPSSPILSQSIIGTPQINRILQMPTFINKTSTIAFVTPLPAFVMPIEMFATPSNKQQRVFRHP